MQPFIHNCIRRLFFVTRLVVGMAMVVASSFVAIGASAAPEGYFLLSHGDLSFIQNNNTPSSIKVGSLNMVSRSPTESIFNDLVKAGQVGTLVGQTPDWIANTNVFRLDSVAHPDFVVGDSGQIKVVPISDMLHANFGSVDHTVGFLEKKIKKGEDPDNYVLDSMKVSREFRDELKNSALLQQESKAQKAVLVKWGKIEAEAVEILKDPSPDLSKALAKEIGSRPQIEDTTQGRDLFGLRKNDIAQFKQEIVQGSGKTIPGGAIADPRISSALKVVGKVDGVLEDTLAPVAEKLIKPLQVVANGVGKLLPQEFTNALIAIAKNPAVQQAARAVGGVAGMVFGGLTIWQAIESGKKDFGELGKLAEDGTLKSRHGLATGLNALSDVLWGLSGTAGLAAGATAITGVGGAGFGLAALGLAAAAAILQGGAWLADGGFEKVVDFAKGALNGAGNLVRDAGKAVQNAGAAIVATAAAAPKLVYETATRMVDKVVPVVKEVVEYVKTKAEEAYQYAVQVPRKIVETVTERVQEAYHVVKQVPRQVTEWVIKKVAQTKQVAKTVYDAVKRSYEWFEDKITTVWDTVREWKTKMVERYEDVRQWVADKYQTMTDRVWAKTGEQVRYEEVPVYGQVAETGGSWVRRGWNWFWNTTTRYVNKIVGWTRRQIIEPVYGWVNRSYQKLVEAGHWVLNKVRTMVPVVYEEIKQVPRQIVEKVRQVKEWIEQVPRTVYETVTEWVDRAVPVVKTVYDEVRETLYRWVDQSVEKTREVIDTVWQTGTRLVEKIVPVTKQTTEYVTQQVEETYEVAKPVIEQVGTKALEYTVVTPAGLVVGAAENVIDMVKAAGTLTYYGVTEPGKTWDAIANYGTKVKDDPLAAGGEMVDGYVNDVESRWGDGTSAFDRARAAGYVGLDVVPVVFSGGVAGIVKKGITETGEKVAKEVGEKIAKEVTEEVVERTEKEAVEQMVEQATKTTVKDVEKRILQESGEGAAKSFMNGLGTAKNYWHGSTSGLIDDAVAYHYQKQVLNQGIKKSVVEYTEDALKTFRENKHLGKEVILQDGTKGILIRRPGLPGGYFTPDGKVVTFWYMTN